MIAVLISLALYGTIFILLSLSTLMDFSMPVAEEKLDEQFMIDVESVLEDLDATALKQTPKGNVDVADKKELSSKSPKVKDVVSGRPNFEKSEPLTAEEKQDSILKVEMKDVVKEVDMAIAEDTVVSPEVKQLIEAVATTKNPTKKGLTKEELDFIKKNYAAIVTIKRLYPSVLRVRAILENLKTQVANTENKREKQNLIKQAEKDLFAQFEKEIRKMSFSQGKLLVKLLARETNQSAYDIIKTYKGSFSASFWYSVGLVFQENLKTQYDSIGEDAGLERMLKIYKTKL